MMEIRARWLAFHFFLLLLLAVASPGLSRPAFAGHARPLATTNAPAHELFLRGIFLFNELNCVQCHAPAADSVFSQGPARQGPVLDGLGGRVKPAWVREFLLDPAKVHPGTTMPRLWHGRTVAESREAVEDLVHFLMSRPGSNFPAPRFADVEFGKRLYREIGCAMCHPADPRQEETSAATAGTHGWNVLSFPDLAAKYPSGALIEFLLNPLKLRPDGRMPGLRLSREEAADLAAYLTRYDVETEEETVAFTVATERVAAGHRVFGVMGCANCHARAEAAEKCMAKPLPDLDPERRGGCLNEPATGVPDYNLNLDQIHALQTALARPRDVLSAPDRLELHLRAFHCLACHERDGRGGAPANRESWLAGDELLGDAGRFPPPLTGAGAKLTAAALTEMLQAKVVTRPYLRLRMPDFGWANVRSLPDLFAAVDQDGEIASDWTVNETSMEAGRILVGTEGGMGCITCHRWKDRPGLTISAVALDSAPERLRPAWFHDYLIDPGAYRPGTLMPSFWPEGVSSHPGVLDGDTDRQIAAIWQFLAEGSEPPSGYPARGSSEYELVPAETAVVQRGFIAPAGTHAIAVGFPEGPHFVFDAESCRPVAMWRGRFIDAYKLWFSRLDPTAQPLGEPVLAWPGEFPVAVAGHDVSIATFRGYELTGPRRVPEFLYDLGSLRVRDRIEPDAESGGLRRTLRLEAAGQSFSVTFEPDQTARIAVTVEKGLESPILAPGRAAEIALIYTWK